MNNKLTKEQAVEVLIKAVEHAQEKGAYNLIDAGNIIMAITIIKTPEMVPVKSEVKNVEEKSKV